LETFSLIGWYVRDGKDQGFSGILFFLGDFLLNRLV